MNKEFWNSIHTSGTWACFWNWMGLINIWIYYVTHNTLKMEYLHEILHCVKQRGKLKGWSQTRTLLSWLSLMPMEIKRQSIFKEVCTELVCSVVAAACAPELGNCVTGFCIQLPLNLYTMTTDVIISVYCYHTIVGDTTSKKILVFALNLFNKDHSCTNYKSITTTPSLIYILLVLWSLWDYFFGTTHCVCIQ